VAANAFVLRHAGQAHSPAAAYEQCTMNLPRYITIGWHMPPENCSFPWDIYRRLIHGSLDSWEWSAPKRHLNRFCHFCTARPCAQHTDHATCHIYSNGPHL